METVETRYGPLGRPTARAVLLFIDMTAGDVVKELDLACTRVHPVTRKALRESSRPQRPLLRWREFRVWIFATIANIDVSGDFVLDLQVTAAEEQVVDRILSATGGFLLDEAREVRCRAGARIAMNAEAKFRVRMALAATTDAGHSLLRHVGRASWRTALGTAAESAPLRDPEPGQTEAEKLRSWMSRTSAPVPELLSPVPLVVVIVDQLKRSAAANAQVVHKMLAKSCHGWQRQSPASAEVVVLSVDGDESDPIPASIHPSGLTTDDETVERFLLDAAQPAHARRSESMESTFQYALDVMMPDHVIVVSDAPARDERDVSLYWESGVGPGEHVYEGIDRDARPFAFKLADSGLAGGLEGVTNVLRRHSLLTVLCKEYLVTIQDVVTDHGCTVVAMDCTPSLTLRHVLDTFGGLRPADAASLGCALAGALHEVHRTESVHGDLRPENVLLDASDLHRRPELAPAARSADRTVYTAPEVAEGQPASAKADLYSLGVVLHELCSGAVPAKAERLDDQPSGIPDELWRLSWRLVEPDPADRPKSARHVAEVLKTVADDLLSEAPKPHHEVLTPAARRKRRRSRVVLCAATIVVGIAGALVFLHVPTERFSAEVGTLSQTSTHRVATPVPPVRESSVTQRMAPNLVGKSLNDAREALGDAKFEILQVPRVGRSPDTVVSQFPPAGEPFDGKVTLSVTQDTNSQSASAPDTTWVALERLKPSAGKRNEVRSGTDGKGGQLDNVPPGKGEIPCDQEGFVEYDLSGKYRRLSATARLQGKPVYSGATVKLVITVDGRSLLEGQVKYGQPLPVDVDVTGGRRLKIVWRSTDTRSTCASDALVLDEAKLAAVQ